MPIQGLEYRPTVAVPNVSDDVGASLEALTILGWNGDQEQARESITADFERLTVGQGRPGENYVQLPLSEGFALSSLVAAIDGATYKDGRTFPETYTYKPLWTPGQETGSYTTEQMNKLGLLSGEPADWPMHARRALTDGPNANEPLLHFLDQPFDEKYAEAGEQTQLQALAEAQVIYAAENRDFDLGALNPAGFGMLALMRRIKGESMPMQWGFARIPQLGRTSVDGYSIVGDVYSLGYGQLEFGGSDGDADSGVGVGLSVGHNQDLNPQAS